MSRPLREDIVMIVYDAINEVDARSTDDRPIEKTPTTPLLGSDQGMDSLTFVNLIVAIEERIRNTFGKSVVLVNEESMALQQHPFRTIGTLVEYVESVLAQQ